MSAVPKRGNNEPDPAAPDTATLRRRVLVRIPIYVVFMMAVLLLAAGRLDWWMAWAYVGVMAATVIPTALEDRTLQRELEGYAEYTQRVRYRLVPGIW